MKLLPQLPRLAGALREQVFARETHGDSKTLCAFSNQHDVARVFDDRLGDERNVFYIADPADRSRAASRSVHATGIEFDNALFVRQPTKSNAIFEGIVLRPVDHAQSRVERVAAALQKQEC